MSLFESIYLKKYNSLMKKINDLNTRNVKGYPTFREYVLSDEIMISYFWQLKDLEKKYYKLSVDSFETFQKRLYEQLDEIYKKKLKEINRISDNDDRLKKMNDLKQNIKDSYGHGCNPQLNIILEDISKKIENSSDENDFSTNNIKEKIINKENTHRKRLEFFDDFLDDWLYEDGQMFKDEYLYYKNNCCPNCGCIIDKKVTSSKKCNECNEKMIVRTNKITSEKLLMSEKRISEYDKHDKKRSELLYYDKMIEKRKYLYDKYLEKFYDLKAKSADPRNVVFPFVSYVGGELDREAYKNYMQAINMPEKDLILESFEIIREFERANLQYNLLAEISDYEGHPDIALDSFATTAYRAVQIGILEGLLNPIHKMETIDFMNYIFPGMIINFLDKSGYSYEDFKKNFIEKRHPFILPQLSNEESWRYVEETFKLYRKMDEKR